MPLAIWKQEFVTGNAAIDQQHQRLFDMVNVLHEGILNGSGKDIMAPAFKSLASYTWEHFRTEEGFMTAKKYPGYALHKKRHEELAEEILDLERRYDEGSTVVLPVTVSKFLNNWLSHHIEAEDKALADWLRTKE